MSAATAVESPAEVAQLVVLAELFNLARGREPTSSEAAQRMTSFVWREHDGRESRTRGEAFGKAAFVSVRGRRRQTQIKSFTGHLLNLRVDPLLILGLLQSWNLTHCSPPLSPEAVEGDVRWVVRKRLAERRSG